MIPHLKEINWNAESTILPSWTRPSIMHTTEAFANTREQPSSFVLVNNEIKVKSWNGITGKGLFIWYGNNSHSRMSFIPDWSLYCIYMTKLNNSARVFSLTWFSCKFSSIRMHHSLQTTQFAVFDDKWILFSGHDTRMKFPQEQEFHPEWNPEGLVRGRNVVSVSCRETYGNGMNWFQNESHSGIMWIAS